jgi:outer membrane protein assembly factor BamB
MSRSRLPMWALLWAALLFLSPTVAQDWTQWRGARRDGAAINFAAPNVWPKSLTLKWKVLTGSGFSSPLVAQNRIYLHTRDEEKGLEVVTCLDINDGKTVWQESYPATFAKNQYAVKMGKGPNSTPVLYDGKLFTLGVTAILSSFDAKSGKLLWRKDYSQQVDTSKLFCGTAMSPVVEQGAVIVHVGDDREGSIIAFDAKSGAEKWRWDGDGPGYASPIVVTFGGTKQLVTQTDKSVVGIATGDGKLLWKMPFPDEWNENIVTPIVYQDMLILSGIRRGTLAVKVTQKNNQWTTEQAWNNKGVAMYMNSPVLIDHLLFGFSHLRKGQFFCLDARTGATLWTTEGREGENAAIVKSGELLFLLTNDGALTVAKKNEQKLEPLAKYQVANSQTWSYPVLLGKQILVKDGTAVTLWSL